MKKTLVILVMALLVALPVFGLAAEAPATPEAEPTTAQPFYGRRWRQTVPEAPATTPQTAFEDADNDGICDNCGQPQGQNPAAPNFTDENQDGVCDNLGTENQGQGRQDRAVGRGRHMSGRGMMGKGQGRNFVDANGDGLCDHAQNPGMRGRRPGQGQFAPSQPGARPGRNRR